MVLDHIQNEVAPIHEKCAKLQRDTRDVLGNTTTTQNAEVHTLEKVEDVSKKVEETSTSYEALPTLNTRPLSAMVSDITSIRGAFQALKLSSSLQKLRQGKDEQQEWLDEHKPRVLKLRQEVAEMKSLIESLKDISCKN
jgi:vacuolar-type H+-ATPase subunit I/STV1